MAGIGFELQQLNLRGDLSGRAGSIVHAAVIAAGPWMFTILAIGLIGILSEKIVGLEALSQFRIMVIYGFAISLFTTAPVGILATRMMADAIYARRFHLISHLFVAALLLGLVVTALPVAIIYRGVYTVPAPDALAAAACCLLVAMIWIAHAFCGAVRDYRGITAGFLTGMALGAAGAVFAAVKGFGPAGILWGFNSGLAVIFFVLASRVLLTFPHPVTNLSGALKAYFVAGRRYVLLALAATVAVAGIWIDKLIMWGGSAGETVASGLPHAPLYDSAMFIAYLVVIPSLSFFVMNLETDFFRDYQRYYAAIRTHATLRQIEERARHLQRETLASLLRILVIQAALCAILVLAAPMIIEALNLQFRQITILRFGAIGASFQFAFMAATSLLLFFDRQRSYLALQLLFLVLNAGLTQASLGFDFDHYGLGYLAASLISSLAAIVTLARAFDELDYHTFMTATRRPKGSDWLATWRGRAEA